VKTTERANGSTGCDSIQRKPVTIDYRMGRKLAEKSANDYCQNFASKKSPRSLMHSVISS
jgi:hypothetical protein